MFKTIYIYSNICVQKKLFCFLIYFFPLNNRLNYFYIDRTSRSSLKSYTELTGIPDGPISPEGPGSPAGP